MTCRYLLQMQHGVKKVQNKHYFDAIAHEIDKEVGQNLRKIRRIKGFSQSELGEKLNLTFQQIQKYERGLNRISAGKLKRIAKILGVEISSLYGEDYEEYKDPDKYDLLLTMETQKLTEKQKRSLRTFLKDVSNAVH